MRATGAGPGSATDPGAAGHVPAVAAVFPTVGCPAVSRARRGPAAGHPDVPAAHPVPVTADPDIARLRGRAVDLHLRYRRCDRDRSGVIAATGIVATTGGNYDAGADGQRHGGR